MEAPSRHATGQGDFLDSDDMHVAVPWCHTSAALQGGYSDRKV